MRSSLGSIVAVALLTLSCSRTSRPPEASQGLTSDACSPPVPAPTEAELRAQLTPEEQAEAEQAAADIEAGNGSVVQGRPDFRCDDTVLSPGTMTPAAPVQRLCEVTSTAGLGPLGGSVFCSDFGIECRTLFFCTRSFAMPPASCTPSCPPSLGGFFPWGTSLRVVNAYGFTPPMHLTCALLSENTKQALCAPWMKGLSVETVCPGLIPPPVVTCQEGDGGMPTADGGMPK